MGLPNSAYLHEASHDASGMTLLRMNATIAHVFGMLLSGPVCSQDWAETGHNDSSRSD